MKKILIIFLILAILITCMAIFVNLYVLPVKAKLFITEKLQQALERKVEITTLRYMPLSTLSLGGINIYDDLAGTRPFLKIESLKFNISPLPFITKRKIISKLDINNLVAKNAKLKGSVRTRLSPAPEAALKYTGSVKFTNFSLSSDSLAHPVERFSGLVELTKNNIQINTADFYFNDLNYKLSGGYAFLEEPEINIALNSDVFSSSGKFILKDDYIQIEKLNAQIADSSVELFGDIRNLPNPFFNVYGKSRVNLDDITPLLSGQKQPLKISGICDAEIFFKGAPNQLRDVELGVKAKSDKILVGNIAFDNFYVDMRMKNGLVVTPKLLATFYGGIISGSVSTDILSNDSPYTVDLAIQDMSLARFCREFKFEKEISGSLSSKMSLKGYGADLNNLSGTGWLTITNGYLWETPVLGGLANILGTPYLKSVVFEEAAGNFSINKRTVRIADLVFYSDKANISVNGDIDFDTNLNFMVTTNISGDFVSGSSDMAKITNILIQQAGQFLGKVRITGTLKDPKYSFQPLENMQPVETIFKKETQNKIGDLLKDILE